jgi:hypothetical protein
MSECDIQGDYTAAVEAAVMATQTGELKTPEQYQAYMTIGRRIVEPEEAERPLLECVRISPDRREAFGELAQMHLQRGDAAKALAYAKIMDAIPSPAPRPQNHDPSIYGWRAHDILCHAESANGINPTKRRKAWHRDHGIRISVIHPTCRPEKALETRKIWMDRATKPENIEYIFGINCKEPLGPVEHYHHALSAPVPEGYSSAVANYNAAAAAATGPIIIAAQDDIYPPHGWDEGVWKLLSPHTGQSKVLHVFDGFSTSQLMVIMCVTRAWLRKHGTLTSAESRLAFDIKDGRNRHTTSGGDLLVSIEEGQPQAPGQGLPDRGLARTHHADQEDGAVVHELGRRAQKVGRAQVRAEAVRGEGRDRI